MGPLTILANPGHGNGPTVSLLLAAEAVQQLSKRPVNLIFPYMGKRQQQVVGWRKNPSLDVRVFYAPALGALLHPITLRDNDFGQNVDAIAAYQAAVQALAFQYLAGGLTAWDSAGETHTFPHHALDFELNHGSRIRFLETERAYYFFPCLLSDLLQHAADLPDNTQAHALARIEKLEAGYRRLFLPTLHTFSWDAAWEPAEAVTFMPFPRPVIAHPPPISQPGIYVMQSGVGPAGDSAIVHTVQTLLSEAERPLALYCPLNTQLPQLPPAAECSPTVIAHPDIVAVVGRAGWGTLWECFNAATPFIAIPPIPGDDPEIHFNTRTLESTGLGLVAADKVPLYRSVQAVQHRLYTYMQDLEARFGSRDGLQTMARLILDDLEEG